MKKIILIALAVCIAAIENAHGQTPWFITGNAGTNATTNFIGTTDNVAFKIRTKNLVRVTVNGAGKVGIGITSPVFKLDVKGGSINTDSVYRIGGNTVLSVKGTGNTFTGIGSGISNTTGSYNTVNGVNALYSNTTGHSNTAIGINALVYNTTGYYNTASGRDALFSNTTGYYNTANGWNALFANTTGHSNTATGVNALVLNTTGTYNTASGRDALYSNTTGFDNTANGYGALLFNTTGNNNTANGKSALFSNTIGYSNTANGGGALYSNTTGSYNTANGYNALVYNTTGTNNTANGKDALYSNTSGYWNTASGANALYSNTTGNDNTAFGYYAGLGAAGVDFNQCTFLGSYSYPTVARTNVTMLGSVIANAQCTGDNQLLLGNTSLSQIRAQVTGITAYSDSRFKFNIKDDIKGLDFIMKLKPVTYNEDPTILHRIWGTPDSLVNKIDHSQIQKQRFIGFLAQDVEKAAKESGFEFPGIDVPENDKEVYSLRYVDFIMPLVKAVQELNEERQKSEVRSQKLEVEIENLKSEIRNMKSGMKQSASTSGGSQSEMLFQNSPNPFNSQTEIKFQLPEKFHTAQLIITDANGKQVRNVPIQSGLKSSSSSVIIKAAELSAGTYTYSLGIDGVSIDSKQMILTK